MPGVCLWRQRVGSPVRFVVKGRRGGDLSEARAVRIHRVDVLRPVLREEQVQRDLGPVGGPDWLAGEVAAAACVDADLPEPAAVGVDDKDPPTRAEGDPPAVRRPAGALG